MPQDQSNRAEMPISALPSLLSDKDLADILVMTIDWVRSHACEIPGFKRLGSYFRFSSRAVEQWLGSFDPLFVVDQVAVLAKVPESWVYANADENRRLPTDQPPLLAFLVSRCGHFEHSGEARGSSKAKKGRAPDGGRDLSPSVGYRNDLPFTTFVLVTLNNAPIGYAPRRELIHR